MRGCATLTEVRMSRRLLIAVVILFAVSFAAPGAGYAQAFKVEKHDIKGEGGTDYVAVEAATASAVDAGQALESVACP